MGRPLVTIGSLEPGDEFLTPGGSCGTVLSRRARAGHVATSIKDRGEMALREGTLVWAVEHSE